MDLTVIYSGLGDLVALGATAIAAIAARQSNKSSGKANQTAGRLPILSGIVGITS